jgi:hypothetical protein
MAYFDKNDMAAALTVFPPTSPFECTNCFRSRDRRKLGHQRLTSTSRTSTASGIPLAALVSRQPAIASRMLAMASCSVLPWEIHPGMEGHSTTKVPVSSRSKVTSNFIENNFTRDSSIRQLNLLDSPDKLNIRFAVAEASLWSLSIGTRIVKVLAYKS